MPADVFEGIQKQHILSAIQEINKDGVRAGRHSTTYDLVYDGERYPPKYVLSLAARYATGKEIEPDEFEGGVGTPAFSLLAKMGFRVIPKKVGAMDPREFATGDR